MLKSLLKKQFLELKNVFFPVKSGVKRKSSFFATTAGLVVLILITAGAAVFYSYTMAEALSPLAQVMPWLYFCISGMFTVAIGSVFGIIGVYTGVYRATDNDLLLSLPIKPSLIVFTRIISNYIVDLFLTAVMWIPFAVKYFTIISPSALAVIFSLLALFFIPLLCSAIALALGFIVSLITMKLKNNGIVVAIIAIVAIALFYLAYFRMGNTIGEFLSGEDSGEGFKTWGVLFYRLGLAATGDALSALIFFGVSLTAFSVLYILISVNFIKMITVSAKSGKVKVIKTPYKSRSLYAALFLRETKRFFSNANYILNCGLSAVFILAFGVAAIFLGDKINAFIDTLSEQLPVVSYFSPIIIPALLMMLLFMGGSATPSVSLEGKSLFIIRSLPVKSKSVLMVKEYFQIVLNILPAVFCAVSVSVALGGGFLNVVSEVAFTVGAVLASAASSIYFGIIKADVNWTNETAAIKSNMGVLFEMLIGYAAAIFILAVYYLIVDVIGYKLNAEIYITFYTVVMFATFFVINKWVGDKGVKKFESL